MSRVYSHLSGITQVVINDREFKELASVNSVFIYHVDGITVYINY